MNMAGRCDGSEKNSSMYYKAFKDYSWSDSQLRKCSSAKEDSDSAPAASDHPLAAFPDVEVELRKPPKVSLKRKMEEWERLRVGSVKKPVGPALSTVSKPESSLEAEDVNNIEKGFRQGGSQAELRHSPDAEGENWPGSEGSDRNAPGNESPNLDFDSFMADDLVGGTHRRNSVLRKESSWEKENDEKIRIVEVHDEKVALDSEAGLCAKPEAEGPFEPLVLWPPPGEGPSNPEGMKVVQVPAAINSRLLEHQREGVRFLYNLYRNDKGGILGDDMGLGKTIQTIAFFSAILKNDSDSTESHGVSIPPVKIMRQRQNCAKVALVVCPTTVVKNWEQEIHSWGDFQVGIYHGAQKEAVLAQVAAKELEIVVTSIGILRRDAGELLGIDWDCVVVDEAHQLKTDTSQTYIACSKLKTPRRYGLTGTAMQNKFTELFNIFDWATPRCLGSREHFRDYYANPIAEGQRISAPPRFVTISQDRQKHLFVVLQSFLLRRTKQETIGHLMKGKVDTITFCPMSALQTRVYQRVLRSPDYQALIEKGSSCPCGSPLTRGECCHRTVPDGAIWQALHKDNLEDGCPSCPNCLILPCIIKLRLLSNHVELIKPNPADESNDEEKWEKDCSFARVAFGEDIDLAGGLEHNENFLGISDSEHCGKMSAVGALLASWTAEGDKVLLFSESVRMLNILEKFLTRKGYDFCRLDGKIAMNQRQTLVESFNKSPSKQIFLISTRAGGLGLNLTSANRVVIFDPSWNPAIDLQAQDRSFRFGQNRHVTVYRLLAAGSLEELIYTRQIYKQQMSNIAMSGAPEKRYFEGVQGSKQHKGELFGLNNLFRDLSEVMFAEDIIENHDERLIRIQRMPDSEPESTESPDLFGTDVEHAESEVDNEGTIELPVAAEDDIESPDRPSSEHDHGNSQEELRTLRIVQKGLLNAGVVYTHRNEDVVNFMPTAPKVHKAKEGKQASVKVKEGLQASRRQSKREEKVDAAADQKVKKGRAPRPQTPREQKTLKSQTNGAPDQLRLEKQSVVKNKKKLFAQLAKCKGMDLLEFSRWYSSATPLEKAELPKTLVNV